MTTIPTIPEYSGIVPVRDSQNAVEFATNVGTYLEYTNNTFVPNTNNTAVSLNTLSGEINAIIPLMEQANSTYKGDWVAGYNTVGYALADAVSYADGTFISKLDNNLIEPTPNTSDTNWDYIAKPKSLAELTAYSLLF